VQHTRFHEGQRTPAQLKALALLDREQVKSAVKMAGQILGAHFGAVDRFFFADAVHDARQPAGVIHFGVIADHEIDFGRIEDLRNIGQQLVAELFFNRIDQSHLLIDDQKSVVACPQGG
jgi:hypothetical protein